MLARNRFLSAAIIVVASGAFGAGSDAETMSGSELRELYSKDVTECGAFPQGAEFIDYCELWQVGGSIVGQSDTEYSGSYRILVSKAEVCVTIRDDLESCGPYENLGENKFRIVFVDGSPGVVTIVPGDVKGLN